MKRFFFHQTFFLSLALASFPVFAADAGAPGVPNFHQVNEHIYRGGQPNDQGFKSLSNLGVKTVIDLRREGENGDHSISGEQKAVEAAGMKYFSFPMQGVVAPSNDVITKILALLNSDQPVFVHCKQGKDRTGAVIACYRISHDRWENQKALKEAKSLGMHWMQVGIKRYISDFKAPVQQVNATDPTVAPATAQP